MLHSGLGNMDGLVQDYKSCTKPSIYSRSKWLGIRLDIAVFVEVKF